LFPATSSVEIVEVVEVAEVAEVVSLKASFGVMVVVMFYLF
jgi:hypothetical protein